MTTKTYKARAPLRLGLAGGGTDLSPYCDTFGGAVLNAAIDRYAYASIKPLDEPFLRLSATDQRAEYRGPSHEPLLLDGNLDLHKSVYTRIMKTYNNGEAIPLELSTFCDTPPGSGLGSSSTLVVAMINAFVEFLKLPLDDYAVARLAYVVERVDCGLQGGRQDMYSAAFGGFNFMEFYADDHAVITPLRVKSWIICELEASLVLYFSGVSRSSADIIAAQSANVAAEHEDALLAMHGLKREAVVMKECLLRGDFPGIVQSMRQGWVDKKRSAQLVSNAYVDALHETAMRAGAMAGKASGAGGGGFLWFLVPPDRRMDVISSLNQHGGQASSCHFTKHGTQAWSTV